MEENNKIIAEFMGASIFEKDGYFNVINWSNPKDNLNKIVQATPITMWGTKEETYLNVLNGLTNESYGRWGRFKSDWNWLMKVVEKIESIKDSYHGRFGVYIGSNSCTIQATNFRPDKPIPNPLHYYDNLVLNTKIESTYNAVVRFINFYNKQKEE